MLEQSKKLLSFGVELLNVGSKIVHKQGVLTIFQLSDEAMALASLDPVALKAEWPAGSLKANLSELVSASKAKLDLANKDVQAKLSHLLDLGVKGAGLAEDVLGYAKELQSALS